MRVLCAVFSSSSRGKEKNKKKKKKKKKWGVRGGVVCQVIT